MAVVQQCVRAGLVLASVHVQPGHSLAGASVLLHRRPFPSEYIRQPLRQPFRGMSRTRDDPVNCQRFIRLPLSKPLVERAAGPSSAHSFPKHSSLPCLFRGVYLVEPYPAWSPAPCIRPGHACAPLIALIDDHKVIGWRISHPIEAVVRLDSGVRLNC